jgi:hypothetical protein
MLSQSMLSQSMLSQSQSANDMSTQCAMFMTFCVHKLKHEMFSNKVVYDFLCP